MPPKTDAPAAADETAADADAAVAVAPDAAEAAVQDAGENGAEPANPGPDGGAQADAPAAADAPVAQVSPSRADPASLGLARIQNPEGATSCSFGGQSYEADADGVITVPLTAVADLTSHGFRLV